MAEDSSGVAIVAIMVILVVIAAGIAYIYRDRWFGVTTQVIRETVVQKENTTTIKEVPVRDREIIREEKTIIVPQQGSQNISY